MISAFLAEDTPNLTSAGITSRSGLKIQYSAIALQKQFLKGALALTRAENLPNCAHTHENQDAIISLWQCFAPPFHRWQRRSEKISDKVV
jgi:hypothetical protein